MLTPRPLNRSDKRPIEAVLNTILWLPHLGLATLLSAMIVWPTIVMAQADPSGKLPEEVDEKQSYMPVVVPPFEEVFQQDSEQREAVVQEHQELLQRRYDLSDRASEQWMSGERRKVQKGVRVKLPKDTTWQELAKLSPQEIHDQELWPEGFRPIPLSYEDNCIGKFVL